MARPIDRDPDDPSVPLWLSQGRRTAEITDQGANAGESSNVVAERIRSATKLPAHRAREYERAFRFLATLYPDNVAEKKVEANFVAVSQLSILHRLDRARALELGPGVMKGDIKAGDLRHAIDEILAARGAVGGDRVLNARRGHADYRSAARAMLIAQPELLGVGAIDEVREFGVNDRFEPMLAMRQGQHWIAVEVSAASAYLSPHKVGHYLARLAQLEQKYDRAILVLPDDRGDIAEMVKRFQYEWIGREPDVVLIATQTAEESA